MNASILNSAWEDGMSAGLRIGLRSAGVPSCPLHPHVAPSTADWLLWDGARAASMHRLGAAAGLRLAALMPDVVRERWKG